MSVYGNGRENSYLASPLAKAKAKAQRDQSDTGELKLQPPTREETMWERGRFVLHSTHRGGYFLT